MARHVGRTDAELMARLASSRARGASVWHDQVAAEVVISRAVGANRARIQLWLRSRSRNDLALLYTGTDEIGRGVYRGESAVSPRTNATVVFRRSPKSGYHVLTAYPE